MRVRPLLRSLRHRAKITPVRIALEWELPIDREFNSMLYGRHVQPFSLAGHIRFLESYCGPDQFLLDENLIILLQNWLSGHPTDVEYMV